MSDTGTDDRELLPRASGASAATTISTENTAANSTFFLPACYLNQEIPTTGELLEVIINDPARIFTMSVAVLLVICTVLMYLEGQFFILKRITGRRKVRISFVFSLYPVFSATAMCGFFIPKANIVAKITSDIWVCVVLFQFVLLLEEYYGTKDKMLSVLHGIEIPLAGPPCCCCCWRCLPSVLINENNIGIFYTRVKIMVLQVTVLRPILWFVSIILWINGSYNEGTFSILDAYPYMTFIAIISNLLALQGLVTFFRISLDPLSSYKIRPKFFTVQLVLIITSIQSIVINYLGYIGVTKCLGPYSPMVNAKMIINFTVIVEMFFFMILAAIWYRRVEGNVDRDVLERRSYKQLSRTLYRRNPADRIILKDAPNDSSEKDNAAASKVVAPSTTQNVQLGNGVWQHKEAKGSGAAIDGATAHSMLGERSVNNQTEQLLSSNATDTKVFAHTRRPSSFISKDSFASFRETDV